MEEVLLAIEQISVFKRPNPLRGDCSKRNQDKYCQYHKDVGHTTKEYVMLKDGIKKLICNEYLQDYVRDKRARLCSNQNEVELLSKIRTIFGRLHFAEETRGA